MIIYYQDPEPLSSFKLIVPEPLIGIDEELIAVISDKNCADCAYNCECMYNLIDECMERY